MMGVDALSQIAALLGSTPDAQADPALPPAIPSNVPFSNGHGPLAPPAAATDAMTVGDLYNGTKGIKAPLHNASLTNSEDKLQKYQVAKQTRDSLFEKQTTPTGIPDEQRDAEMAYLQKISPGLFDTKENQAQRLNVLKALVQNTAPSLDVSPIYSMAKQMSGGRIDPGEKYTPPDNNSVLRQLALKTPEFLQNKTDVSAALALQKLYAGQHPGVYSTGNTLLDSILATQALTQSNKSKQEQDVGTGRGAGANPKQNAEAYQRAFLNIPEIKAMTAREDNYNTIRQIMSTNPNWMTDATLKGAVIKLANDRKISPAVASSMGDSALAGRLDQIINKADLGTSFTPTDYKNLSKMVDAGEASDRNAYQNLNRKAATSKAHLNPYNLDQNTAYELASGLSSLGMDTQKPSGEVTPSKPQPAKTSAKDLTNKFGEMFK